MADSSVDIPAIIREKAAAYGVDPDTLTQIGRVESGLDPNSANPGSSARGLFQQTTANWKQYGNGADPLDPAANADAGARFMASNQKMLTASGIPPTPGALYLSHFAGPSGAMKVLKADPTASAADLLGPAAAKANPFIANMSAGDLQAWADHKMGGAPAGGAPAAAATTQAASAAPVAGGAAPLDLSSNVSAPDSALSPDLMAQLSAVPKMLAQQQDQMPAPAPLAPPVDPAALARARIVQRALAGQPITG
jgi:hypothetical protein